MNFICPECAAGKHDNCDGTAWDTHQDEPTDCSCPCGRCWFAHYGWVDSSSPTLLSGRGRENPNYRPQDDPFRQEDR